MMYISPMIKKGEIIMLNHCDYKMKPGEYPEKPEKPILKKDANSIEHRSHADLLEKYEDAMIFYKSQLESYNKKERDLYMKFKKDLYEEYDVTGNSKADKAYTLAYDYGHSAGYNEIEIYFSQLVELIK